MATRTLEVKIIGDAHSLNRAFGSAGASAGRFGRQVRGAGAVAGGFGRSAQEGAKKTGAFSSALGFMGRTAAYTAGPAAIYGLFRATKAAFGAFKESQQVNRQTTAVLKSTGGAAHVTKKHVQDLATAISEKTGIDDEAIQSGENLLLTFTNIRNEAGKGNKIFNQATRVVNDMSVALGQDMKSSAIQVGKALNDPIKGLTALQRVGVSFTQKQRDTIKSLVASGKTLQAQKIILRELNREFGGSAEAVATPAKKLKVTLGNLAETVGRALSPTIEHVAGKLNGFVKGMLDGTGAGGKFVAALKAVAHVYGQWMGVLKGVAQDVAPAVVGAVTKIRTAVSSWVQKHRADIRAVVEALKNVSVAVKTFLVAAFEFALNVAKKVWPGIKSAVQGAIRVIGGVIKVFSGLLTGDFGRVWSGLKDVVSGALKGVVGILRAAVAHIGAVASQLGKAALSGLTAGLGAIGGAVARLIGRGLKAVVGFYGRFLTAGGKLVQSIASGITGAIGVVTGAVKGLAQGIYNAAAGIVGDMLQVGIQIVQGLANGIRSAAGQVASAVKDVVSFIPNQAKKLLGIFSPSRVMHAIGVNTGEGLANGILASSSRVKAAAAQVAKLFPEEARIAALQAKRDSLQAGFDSSDQRARVAELRRKGRGKGADAASARAELRDLLREIARAKQLAKIDVKIAGLERAKAFRDAIKGIGAAIHDKLDAAVDAFRDKWENTVGKAIDKANEAALDGFDKQTEAMVANSDEAQALAAAQAADKKAAQDEEDKRLQKALADALAANDAEAIADAKAEIERVARERRLEQLEKDAAAKEQAIREQRAAERKALEDQQAADRQARLDADTDAFRTALKDQLDAELAQLQARKENYAQFAKDVQAILEAAGITGGLDVSAEDEAATSSDPKKPKKPKKKPKKHKATGGIVWNPGVFDVGELGRESVYLPRGARVQQASEAARVNGGPLVYIAQAIFRDEGDAHKFASRLAFQLATR